jgi:hypothetical protein
VSVAWSADIPVDAMESIEQLRPFVPDESGDRRIGYGLSIAGHIIVTLLLIFGVFERLQLVARVQIPVEIVMEKSPAAAHQDTSAAPQDTSAAPDVKLAGSASDGASNSSGIPVVADVDKHAKAPQAAVNVNGIDLPKPPGQDGADHAGVVLPVDPNGEAIAAGGASDPSQVMVVAPVGPARPQVTAREPGEDDLTAIKQQKIECGIMAKLPTPAVTTRKQARVRGFATRAQALQIMRSNQAALDRHVNPSYIGIQRLFAESLDGSRRFIVLLPAGVAVNVGDVIEYDTHHIDPLDSCQFIPNLAVGRL